MMLENNTTRQCKIKGCQGKYNAKGYCHKHYVRFRVHGDAETISKPGLKPKVLEYLKSLINHEDKQECVIWPYHRDRYGYGTVKYERKNCIAHRVLLSFMVPPPTIKHQAAHNCGKGRLGCVNPHHLRWATAKENHADKLIHDTHNRGERHGLNKLTESQVLKIFQDIRTSREIAKEYGVSRGAIQWIKSGRSWAWLTSKVDS